jgi:uncharacterized protein
VQQQLQRFWGRTDIMSHTSSVPLFWRLKKSKYMLIGSKCENCGEFYFPPRVICSKCRSRGKIVEHQFSGRGSIEEFTIIRTPPEGFERQAPYAVAIIRLDEGTNIAGQVVGDIGEVKADRRVRAVFRRITQDGADGLINYGIKWEIEG